MRTCDFYFLLAPLRAEYNVDHQTPMLWMRVVELDEHRPCEVSLISSDGRRPELIGVSVPDLPSDELAPEVEDLVWNLAYRVLTAARLTIEPTLKFPHAFPFRMHTFRAPNQRREFKIKITEGPAKFNENVFDLVLGAGDAQQIELRLLADGRDTDLPLPYRYLSFYKCLENAFKRHKSWESAMRDHLVIFQGDYMRLKLSTAPLFSFIVDMRDRCAHIRTGSKEVLGVLGPESPLGNKLLSFMPLMNRIVTAYVERPQAPAAPRS